MQTLTQQDAILLIPLAAIALQLILGFIREKGWKAKIAAGNDPDARLKLYNETLAVLWGVAAMCTAFWLLSGRSFAELGFRGPAEGWRGGVCWGLAAGYPRRAKRLHESAVIMRDRFGGEVPADEAALRELPGVGEYTAAAVAAFAYGRDSIAVDINVRRFLVRIKTGRDPALTYSAAERALAKDVVEALDVPSPLWAAASMEFGALVCTSRNPACAVCPLATMCDWVPGERITRTQAYEGTDRQARGAVLEVLRSGPADTFDWHDQDQLERALAGLLSDGLIVRTDRWSLPQ